jgi:hypothetical protein
MSKASGVQKTVRFGEFLVRRKYVTAGELQATLVVQQDRSPRLGMIARRARLLAFDEVCQVLKRQRSGRNRLRFGEAALQLGLLDEQNLSRLLKLQAMSHKRLGRLLVEHRILSPARLRHGLAQFVKEQKQNRV